MTAPRVAIVGFHLETNSFAPVTTREDFVAACWREGEEISRLARSSSNLPREVPGFYREMDRSGDWVPLPLIVISAPPGGPASAEVWSEFMAKARASLQAVMPVDAIFVNNHGASAVVGEDDSEAVMMEMLRAIAGPGVPIVVTHDLHCNVSERTVLAIDALLSYHTNPHVDQAERAEDAARLIREMLAGMKPQTAYIRLPLTPPSVTLLTARGPYADLVRMGVSRIQRPDEGPIAAVSVAAGFVFADLPKCGLTITVTARNDLAAARRCALEIARAGWADRARYVPDMVEVGRAVEIARAASQPMLFADVADNPGGGGRGNTAWLLKAFHASRLPGVVLGVFVDPPLAARAHALGVGAEFDADFNSAEDSPFSERYRGRVVVRSLHDGALIGRRGIMQGREFSMGLSALLEFTDTGMRVAVGSLRRQLCDPVMLEALGVDIAAARVVIVKSRGHYRAGFDVFFPDDRIVDVDSPGLTTPNLRNVPFKRLPRPVWPLDPQTVWVEPDWATSVDRA
jgi:microcystin degradation protein MlrC